MQRHYVMVSFFLVSGVAQTELEGPWRSAGAPRSALSNAGRRSISDASSFPDSFLSELNVRQRALSPSVL